MLASSVSTGNPDFDKLYSTKEAAEILGVTSRAIQNWIRDGKLRAIKLGRLLKIAAKDIKKFIEDRATLAA